jgi:hypothetical protein
VSTKSTAKNPQTIGLRYVLRTLGRLKRIANKVPAEQLAAALQPHLHSERLSYLSRYLSDVAEYANQAAKRQCAVCGLELDSRIYSVRSDARYCSPGCRQKAYRKRVTARASPTKIDASRRDASLATGSNLSVTPPDMPATTEMRS